MFCPCLRGILNRRRSSPLAYQQAPGKTELRKSTRLSISPVSDRTNLLQDEAQAAQYTTQHTSEGENYAENVPSQSDVGVVVVEPTRRDSVRSATATTTTARKASRVDADVLGDVAKDVAQQAATIPAQKTNFAAAQAQAQPTRKTSIAEDFSSLAVGKQQNDAGLPHTEQTTQPKPTASDAQTVPTKPADFTTAIGTQPTTAENTPVNELEPANQKSLETSTPSQNQAFTEDALLPPASSIESFATQTTQAPTIAASNTPETTASPETTAPKTPAPPETTAPETTTPPETATAPPETTAPETTAPETTTTTTPPETHSPTTIAATTTTIAEAPADLPFALPETDFADAQTSAATQQPTETDAPLVQGPESDTTNSTPAPEVLTKLTLEEHSQSPTTTQPVGKDDTSADTESFSQKQSAAESNGTDSPVVAHDLSHQGDADKTTNQDDKNGITHDTAQSPVAETNVNAVPADANGDSGVHVPSLRSRLSSNLTQLIRAASLSSPSQPPQGPNCDDIAMNGGHTLDQHANENADQNTEHDSLRNSDHNSDHSFQQPVARSLSVNHDDNDDCESTPPFHNTAPAPTTPTTPIALSLPSSVHSMSSPGLSPRSLNEDLQGSKLFTKIQRKQRRVENKANLAKNINKLGLSDRLVDQVQYSPSSPRLGN